ncbi:MAG: hypothetical protein M1816_002332 [Peltula sp. TS41687]|nr:MAG: hypothetical protein M1816_002332 [Peltula sp. TS41687]
MLYAINVIRHGFWIGLLAFLIWRNKTSLPSSLAAYGLARGVAKIDEKLPDVVYALLSGLNSATVGVVALAAVQLSRKAITDKITRILVFFGAAAGILYNALWYFPVLMVVGGVATVIWDRGWIQICLYRVREGFQRRRHQQRTVDVESSPPVHGEKETERQPTGDNGVPKSTTQPIESAPNGQESTKQVDELDGAKIDHATNQTTEVNHTHTNTPAGWIFSWKPGLLVLAVFLAILITIMVLRGVLDRPPKAFSLFANLFLAGTIIFGGGPVVVPLLREYVVAQGWVSPRDFLLGLAIMQAFPGPNFSFAVYLGSLALPTHTLLGAVLAYIGIFAPGLTIHTSAMGLWSRLHHSPLTTSTLRGVNATAVGLIYSAVYRLWQIGFLTSSSSAAASQPLGNDPWWVVVVAGSFTAGLWFGVNAPVLIVLGAVMGLLWFGVVS